MALSLAGTLAIANGGTGAVDAPTARTNLAVLGIANNLSDVANAATARTNLGLGTMATQNANAVAITGGTIAATTVTATNLNSGNVTITGGSITGTAVTGNVTGNVSGTAGSVAAANVTGCCVAITAGGTGAGTAAAARTALGADNASNLTTGTLSAALLPVVSPTSAGSYNWGTVDVYGRVTAASNSSTNSVGQGNSSVTVTDTGTNGTISLITEGATGLTVDPTGKVGIGTTSPLATLHVATPSGSGTNDLIIQHNSTGGTTSSPRVGLIDTSLGAVTAAPMWAIDNDNDLFRIFRQPNYNTVGSIFLTINNAGNVGIGTATPATALQVIGTITTTNLQTPSSSGGMQLTTLSNSPGTGSVYFTAPGGPMFEVAPTPSPTTWIRSMSGTASVPAQLQVVGGSSSLTLNPGAGNVGIGTTTPAEKLEVNGNIKMTGWTHLYNGASNFHMDASPTGSIYLNYFSGGGVYYGNGVGTGATGVWLPNGNVGIQTTSPSQALDVNGYVAIRSINGEGGTIQLQGNNGVNMWLENLNGTFRLLNSPWNVGLFSVDQSGNTTVTGVLNVNSYISTPNYINSNNYVYGNELYTRDNLYLGYLGDWLSNRLNQSVATNSSPTFNDPYVNNWVRINGGGGIYWQAYGGGWYMQDGTWIRSYGGKPMYEDSGFDTGAPAGVGCGGGLGGGFTFRVCGSAYTTGDQYAANFYHASDRRLKTDIKPSVGLDVITKLQGVTFNWKKDGKPSAGVIAQEIQKIMPEAVVTKPDGFMAVNYDTIVAPVIESIKELKVMIDKITDKIAQLFTRVDAHDAELKALRDELKQLHGEFTAYKSAHP